MSPKPATTARRLQRAVTIVLAALAVTAITLAIAHTTGPTTPHPPTSQKLLMPRGYDPYYRVPATTPHPPSAAR
jgi:hypothetical protein